jgi:NAD(P)-dependent dehydrogenase (short-subunit alcohol dehydrogenase family)
MDFQDKVCVITGGANGIGRCIAESFLRHGANIAVIDTDGNAGEQLMIQSEESRCLFYCGDITEERVLTEFSRLVIEKYGRIDCLINNACLSKGGILSGCGFEDFNYVLKLGVTAPYMLAKLFLEHFRPGGSIVNISSTRVYMSQPDTESYTAAKGGITALTHALSISLAGRVRVNAISPGWIDTARAGNTAAISIEDKRQHPAGRIGAPQDIADMVLFLCSERAGFITGENIVIDGGMTKQMIYHGDFGWNFDSSR